MDRGARSPGRVVLISDDDAWVRVAVDSALRIATGAVPERLVWMDAGLVKSRILCLVAHVPDDDPAGTLPVFETWASRALQPVTIVSIGSVPGAWELESRLAELRYTRFVHHDAIAAAEYGAELRQTLPQVVSAHAWLATRVAQVLDCRDPEFIWMLCIALSNSPHVHRWRVGATARTSRS